MQIIQEVVQKVNELFIDTRYKHLFFDKREGTFKTSDIKKNEERKRECAVKGKRYRPFTYLADWKIERHLNGNDTIGVFGQSYCSKFLTFDVDIKDDANMAKWTTLQVVNQMIELGIPQDRIYVSYSGNKGYHVDLYFNEPIKTVELNRFYRLVMDSLGFTPCGKEKQVKAYKANGGEVEMRPYNTDLGVKLPLGIHGSTGNRCWYVDVYDYFKPFETFEYILSVEKLESDVVTDILDEQEDLTLTEQERNLAKMQSYIDERYKPLPVYKEGIDEQITIDAYEKLDREGLKMKGTRHKSTFKLARYYKYLGMDETEVRETLIEWMERQDKRLYDSPRKLWMKEIEYISKYVFEKDLSLVTEKEYINVSKDEMLEIMKAKKKNEMLTLFSMLVHSKRYADKNGVFYMTYKQLNQTIGLTEKNARNNVYKLEAQGLINVLARNEVQKGTYKRKPNKYQLNIAQASSNGIDLKCKDVNLEEQFNKALVQLIPLDVAKKQLSRRHYESIRELYVAA